MNRLLIALVLGIVLFLVLPYFYVPSIIRKRLMAVVPIHETISKNALLYEDRWREWWPADSSIAPRGDTLYYRGHAFRIGNKYVSGLDIYSDHNGDSTKARLLITPLGKDSTGIAWEYDQPTSLNPIKRIMQDRRAKALQTDMIFILQQMAYFLSDEQKIYHIKVNRTTVTDTLLVTTKATLPHAPKPADVYRLVDQLQQYITQAGATATNVPMLHQKKIDSSHVEIIVALPVNKVLNNAGAIAFKRMVPGNILVTEVKGGPGTVKNAFYQLEKYLTDHHYDSPAIPFESLITHRLQEPDTSKWVTRIYYPVF